MAGNGERDGERRRKKAKEGEGPAEGIILLICLDPVKPQIALSLCFMAVLQISFIYKPYSKTRRYHHSALVAPGRAGEYYFYRRR